MPDVWSRYRWLFLILLIAFGVRLYRLNNPIADWHSWRQADTASVTQEYVKNGVDLLRPQYQDLSNIPSGLDNLQGYRMVEFPLFNGAVAEVVRTTGWDLVIISRLLSIGFSLIAIASLFFLVREVSGKKVAYATAMVFAVMPYSIYYSRVILPEPILLGLSCFSILSFYLWLKTKKLGWGAASWIGLVLALLMKPFAVFLAPVYAMMAWQKYGWNIWRRWELVLYAATGVVPMFWWRDWIKQFPSGIPDYDWLFNSNGIRLRPAWFRWLGWERLTKLMVGYVGNIFIVSNVLDRHSDLWLYGAWWAGIIAYFVVIATGNVQHDYYQVIAIPILCITLGRGAVALYTFLKKKFSHKIALGAVVTLSAIAWFLAWQNVKGYFSVNHWEYVEAGDAVNALVPPDAWVIAPAMGDTHFLYQTNRRGWPIGFEIQDKINKGADYYVTTSDDDEARELQERYTVIDKGRRYLIIDLHQPHTSL